jgi:hypothetical protein
MRPKRKCTEEARIYTIGALPFHEVISVFAWRSTCHLFKPPGKVKLAGKPENFRDFRNRGVVVSQHETDFGKPEFLPIRMRRETKNDFESAIKLAFTETGYFSQTVGIELFHVVFFKVLFNAEHTFIA